MPALKESFGSRWRSRVATTDIDLCDTLLLVGHNVAETQTVLWARILDRLAGSAPPRLVVVDPRRTKVARARDRSSADQAAARISPLLNAIEHELIATRATSTSTFVNAHTVGFERLARDRRELHRRNARRRSAVSPRTTSAPPARVIGEAERLVSTCLAGRVPVAPGDRRRRCRSTTSTCCAG